MKLTNWIAAASLAAMTLVFSSNADAGGKRDGAMCHVHKSCESKLCVRIHPADKFGQCCSVQDCPALNAQCGSIDNGCGTPIHCGDCDPGNVCENNQCVSGTTTTTTSTSTTSTTTSTTSTTTSTTSTTTTSTTTSTSSTTTTTTSTTSTTTAPTTTSSTTTSTTATTSTTLGVTCEQDGNNQECLAYKNVSACSSCMAVVGHGQCLDASALYSCAHAGLNDACAAEIQNAGCAAACCD